MKRTFSIGSFEFRITDEGLVRLHESRRGKYQFLDRLAVMALVKFLSEWVDRRDGTGDRRKIKYGRREVRRRPSAPGYERRMGPATRRTVEFDRRRQ